MLRGRQREQDALDARLSEAERSAGGGLALVGDVLELLAEAASDAPLLVTLDDAQWLDGPTVDAIVFAARRLAAERVAVIIVLRDEGDGAPELALPTLHLGGLDPEAVGAMLSDITGGEVPDIRCCGLGGRRWRGRSGA